MNSCPNALMRPTEVFWNRFINPLPIVGNQNCVQELALRIIALVGLMFSMPTYFLGLTLKIISRFCEIAQNGPEYIPPIQQVIAPPILLDSPEIRDAARSLDLMRQFAVIPTWDRYHQLPLDQKYLVAGRHTYPNYWGWNFVTKFTLMNAFEDEFRGQLNLAGAHQGIREAIRIQEKILFAHKLQQALIQRVDLAPLRNQDRDTFNQALYYVAREYDCRRDEDAIRFGRNILVMQPNDPKTVKALDDMVYWLKKAYEPEHLPLMLADPIR